MPVTFHYRPKPILEPLRDDSWAGTAVLNPAIIEDPADGRIHMLFRATGPGQQSRLDGRPLTYPIALGYAWSDDGGATWQADFSGPALAPRLADNLEALQVTDAYGRTGLDYANGCIEDPRLADFQGRVVLTVACRLFPPGPFWEHDDPLQCMPDWARRPGASIGEAGRQNYTVSLAYEVDLSALRARRYDDAFALLGPLAAPERGDNRDVVLFPRPLRVNGQPMIAALHRPKSPSTYAPGAACDQPCIFLAAAPRLQNLATSPAVDQILAMPCFEWEGNRIGASWTPLPIGEREWLIPYHGKQNDRVGYTQSFFILEETESGLPVITHRCPRRLMFASQPWELDGLLPIPCLFSCGGVVRGENLIISYGAADTRCGIAEVNLADLIREIHHYDSAGRAE